VESVRSNVEKSSAETDLQKLETTLDGLGIRAEPGALRQRPALKSLSETCRDKDVSRMHEGGGN